MSLALLLRRDDVVVVDKPPGLAVVPGRGDGGNVRALLEAQLGRPVWVVHRLDRDTSGALVFALTAEAHRAWSMAFEAGAVHKRYLALVDGQVERPLELDLPLAPARKSRMRVSPEGKPAHTRVQPLEALRGATLVEAVPLTGRTHQIRVHLAHAGHPLLFDHQYRRGAQSTLIGRTPLHAAHLQWGEVAVDSPLPQDFAAALAALKLKRRLPVLPS